jgi:hypothetical protein
MTAEAKTKDWRTSIPKWAAEEIKAEMAAMRKTLALRWPSEAKPKAIFGFGDYDRSWNDVRYGEFWVAHGPWVHKVVIREKLDNENGWKMHRFSVDGRDFSSDVQRGHYFETEKDAQLYRLWLQCENKAKELEPYWRDYEGAA